jgi:predicted ATPase with chaperone activity
MSNISGPLMDRIDIQTEVPAVPYKELAHTRAAESSEAIRTRVIAARSVQRRRFFDEHIYTNAQMGPRQIRKHCVLTADCEKIIEKAVTKLGFSARDYDGILKGNRTTGCARVDSSAVHGIFTRTVFAFPGPPACCSTPTSSVLHSGHERVYPCPPRPRRSGNS